MNEPAPAFSQSNAAKSIGVRRVLIVSPHWPPINAPDMQRARMSLPYYRANGWEPEVLTVKDEAQHGVREPELEETIPSDIVIHRVNALPVGWTRRVGLGNLGWRAWFHLFVAGSRLLRTGNYSLVFLTNTQFITFPFGRIWLWGYGVPFVLDVQDPWRTDYYERAESRRPPGGWKYQWARLVAWALEGWSFHHAAGVMSVSPDYLRDLAARYRWFKRIPSEVIRFGTSPDDFVAAKQLTSAPALTRRDPRELHLLYTGASGPVMPHSLTVLFDGLRIYRERHPEKARRLRFHFLGTSYVPPGEGVPSVLPVAVECGVGDQVEEIAHRLGHLECLRLQQSADVLLLPGSSDLAYSPSKIYPYYCTGRPILALVFKTSVMESLLDELNCAYLVRFSQNENKDSAHAALANFFDFLLDGQLASELPPRNDAYFNRHFLAPALTRQQCELFDRSLQHDVFGQLAKTGYEII